MLLGLVLACGLGFGVAAQGTEIQDTISRQLEAFQADDFATAFTFASPNLRSYFRTPEVFGQMVTQGYPMVWRPGDVRYLELREEGGSHWQKVMITDQAGRVHILQYRMIDTPEGWRINGVQILDSADPSV
jgi:hypothetical protein